MATDKFVFRAILLPVASAIPGKASNSKRPLRVVRSSLQLGPSCIFRRTAQPSAMCGALSHMRPRSRVAGVVAKRSAHAGVRGAHMVKICAAPPRLVMTTTFKFDDNYFAYVTASALLTECNSLRTPRFCQTCGRKCTTPCGGQSAKRGLLNNSQ